MKKKIIIATRESPLALCQAEWVKSQLRHHHPDYSVELLGLTTMADKMLNVTLNRIGGKGLFVKELEEALRDKRADIAVHSMKDVPMVLPDGLIIPVICEREEPRDAIVSNEYSSLFQFPSGAKLGTASLRRQSQIKALRPDLIVENLRGNVNSRLKRLDNGEFDGLILAAAGLKRLNFLNRIASYLSFEESLPAAGQGALGVECREDDEETIDIISCLNHADTFSVVSAERALCRHLNGGCLIPIASFAQINHSELSLRGLVANQDGTKIVRAHSSGHPNDAEKIGLRVGEELLARGAAKILAEFI
jgi:hydroxymethylbilane synthase